MPNKNNNSFVIGLILLILGVSSLIQNIVKINYSSIPSLLLGISLVVLYITKRKFWALILGTYLFFLSLSSLFSSLGIKGFLVLSSTFFLAPGIISLILYFQKGGVLLLYQGSFLSWFGIFLALDRVFINGSALLLICFGLAFLTIFLLGKGVASNTNAFVGMFFIFIGISKMLSVNIFNPNINLFSKLFSILIILFGLKVIFKPK